MINTSKKLLSYTFNEKKELIPQKAVSIGKKELPLLILQDIALFPDTTIAITASKKSKLSIFAQSQSKKATPTALAVVTGLPGNEKASSDKSPVVSQIGTEAVIAGSVKLKNGDFGIILKGNRRFILNKITNQKNNERSALVSFFADKPIRRTSNFLALTNVMKNLIVKILQLNLNISQETSAMLQTSDEPEITCNLISPHLSLQLSEQLELLGTFQLTNKIKLIIKHLSRELNLLELSQKIQKNVQSDIKENVRKTFLHEQLAAIKKELGESEEESDELEDLCKEIQSLDAPDKVIETAEKEIHRMEIMTPASPEYMVSWTYVNWIKDLPWRSKEEKFSNVSLVKAKKNFTQHHYGLKKVKERILEYIAVLQHKGSVSGQILLLVGPPGVGKTSLVKSIAASLQRPFAKIALGGVKDEAEIRGHRRTYIGAMPGKILQAVKEAGSSDAVILLDEVDKISGQLHQDIGASLLEVLDPEQNKTFSDNYIGMPFDLSKIIFIATANSVHNISAPLFDRMECLTIPGYTQEEKVCIAQKHIIPQIRKEMNLTQKQFMVSRTLTNTVVNHYTREAGVRELKREIQAMARKTVCSIVANKSNLKKVIRPSSDNIIKLLGPPQYLDELKDKKLSPGVSIGLAYTSVGGDILYVETRKTSAGKDVGRLTLTGSLGKVMQESVQTCMSFLSVNAKLLGISSKEIESSNIHIHFPDGATPKDGPSAGIAILCALSSLFLNKSIDSSIAMTGEATLRGRVLPVGGIKEKVLAAHRYGKTTILLPEKNIWDLNDLPKEALSNLNFHAVGSMLDVLKIVGLVKSKTKKLPLTQSYIKKKLTSSQWNQALL